jgi:hypothetical protein
MAYIESSDAAGKKEAPRLKAAALDDLNCGVPVAG